MSWEQNARLQADSRANRRFNSIDTPRRIPFYLMFPNTNNNPACATQSITIVSVAPPISLNLLLPIACDPGAPDWEPPAVPIVPINEDCDASPREHQIRATGQMFTVLSESETPRVNQLPYSELWSRVLAANTRHHMATLFRCEIVHQR